MRKKLGAVLLTLALSAAWAGTAWAGWETDGTSWWYNYDEGGYASSGIRNIDGVNYCFSSDGYMLTGSILTGDGISLMPAELRLWAGP